MLTGTLHCRQFRPLLRFSKGRMLQFTFKSVVCCISLARQLPPISDQHTDINAIPLYKGRPHHQFLYDSVKALNLCHNLSDFRLGINIFPTYISTLLPKERLRAVSFNGSLTEAQVQAFSQLPPAIHSLHVEHGSWCLMNYFPSWMAKLSSTLKHLSINVSEISGHTI